MPRSIEAIDADLALAGAKLHVAEDRHRESGDALWAAKRAVRRLVEERDALRQRSIFDLPALAGYAPEGLCSS